MKGDSTELFAKGEINNKDSFELWHPINGKWVHIQQIKTDVGRDYYTNGVKEFPADREVKP